METPAKRGANVPIMSPIPEDKEKIQTQHGGNAPATVTQGTNPTGSAGNASKNKSQYAGPFRLMESLGKGGLATVKVGVDLSGQRVAVKIVDKTKLSNPREQVSMAREITIMKLLKHPNILRLYDVYEDSDRIFLILDIYEGGDLYSHLTKYGAMRPSEALVLFRQLMKGIEFCHKNLIVHRDLKPENLLLSRDKKTLVLSDFGLSTGMAGQRNLLKTRCGTVHYISPEVAKGDPYVGMASDVWSCGIILFAMVTASLPFDGETSIIVLKKIVKGEYVIPSNLPPDLKDLIRKMLTSDPHTRITIPMIRQHAWFKLGASKEDLLDCVVPIAVDAEWTEEELRDNLPILENLKLLGWEETALKEELLSTENNQAKFFFKLLVDHKNLSTSRRVRSPTSPLSPNSDRNRPRASSTDNTVPVRKAKKPGKMDDNEDDENEREKEKDKEKEREKEMRDLRESRENKENKENREPRVEKEVRDKENMEEDKENARVPSILTRAPLRRPATVESRSTNSQTAAANNACAAQSLEVPIPRSRQRAATVGTDDRPEIGGRPRAGNWGVSPANDPEAKIFTVESRKSLNQILESLKVCFQDLELEFSEKKQKKDTVKVKGRLSAGKMKKTQVVVEVKITDNGNVVHFKRSGKKSTKKEEFNQVCKKIEETLLV